MNYEEIVESRIREAMDEGAFRDLPGEGRPLPPRIREELAGDNWVGFKILNDHDMLPEWLLLAREIEQHQQKLEEIDREHGRLTGAARAGDRWERLMPGIHELRAGYEREAKLLRRKQDRFNYEAPSIHLERPAIWVERHLDRLDSRLSCPLHGDDSGGDAPISS